MRTKAGADLNQFFESKKGLLTSLGMMNEVKTLLRVIDLCSNKLQI